MTAAAPGPGGAGAAPSASPPNAASGGETEAVRALRERLGSRFVGAAENRGQWRVTLDRDAVPDAVRLLKEDPALAFELLADVSAIDDHPDEPRFRVFWVLRSFRNRDCVVLQARVPEDDCRVPTVAPLFAGADWLERECYDMFGIEFRGHPDLRRIMMPDEFPDFPMRKDFPVQGRMTDQEWAEIIIAKAQRMEGDRP